MLLILCTSNHTFCPQKFQLIIRKFYNIALAILRMSAANIKRETGNEKCLV